MKGDVPVGPLREAFVRSGMTIGQVARIMGVDHSHVARMLGERGMYVYRPYGRGRYGPYMRKTVTYENAARLALAMGIDPVEVGA